MNPKTCRWLALFALSLPVVALSVDMNGVVVLLPTIAEDLGVTPAGRGCHRHRASRLRRTLLLIGRSADRVGALRCCCRRRRLRTDRVGACARGARPSA